MAAPTSTTSPDRTASVTRVDLAIQGIRLADAPVSRRAGAGPSDDGHLLLDGVGAAIPLNPRSPYTLAGVLATTVVQTCVRYDEDQRCRFCAIEESLRQGSTIAVKSPAQIAEVAKAAHDLDGITQMVMTTGTSNGRDRGATHLARCVRAVREVLPDLPIQVQCEPPGDLATIQELYDAGARSIGIHVESLDDDVRRRWMPGKGSVPMSEYRAAWAEAVRVFGWNEVSTYLLLGLGEDPDETVAAATELIEMGVYPFVVPFRPLAGTLATDVDGVPAPEARMVASVTARVGAALRRAGMLGAAQSAGCAACGACSALSCEGA